MSWKKYFTPVSGAAHNASASAIHSKPGPARSNYSSYLPDVYAGAPNRVDRYLQYDVMDNDPEVNAALDIIAEFCTQKDNENRTPFNIFYRGTPTSAEVKLLKDCLQKWCKLQQFETRIFRIFRNTLKYGDCIFLRDPETKKWLFVDNTKVTKIIANESIGKIPTQYGIRDLNFNFLNLVATTPHGVNNTVGTGSTSYTSSGTLARGMVGASAQSPGTRFQNAQNEIYVNADNVVHIGLSEGMDSNFPFGNSLLETVFKVYKQKELLEDAIIIYRVQRAPERRIFYIDVGNMPAHMAMSFVERVKTEIQQRRIPSTSGNGTSVVDSSYSPIAQNEDFWLPQGSDGRGSKIETLPGGCFSMDTKVSLLDGRELSIREIESELNLGKELWTYSCEPITGKVEPGLISWAGVTRKSAKVMKITLDNGEHIICTPDHRFPVYEQDYKRAYEFNVGDGFISTNDISKIITAIEYLDDEIEVGTLTIDQDEKYHNYHTFALSSGVFTLNSNIGEITDLRYFTNKLFRALRIPAAYLPTGLEEASNTVADGKVGTAYIQELRFNEYCKRLQNMIVETFDLEFKLWLYGQGINIDSSLYQLKFNEPQNFASYRQAELDNTRVSIFTQLQEITYLSKIFAMKRFLGMTQEEITENETMWKEENYEKVKSDNAVSELRSAGVTPGGMASDMSGFNQELPDQGIDAGTSTDSAPMPAAGEVPASTPG